MAWQSTPSGEQWIERDDDASGPTIPEKPAPGERFMEKGPCGIWAVFDWEAACSRCGGCGVDRPGSNCPCDPSDQVFEPYEVAGGLSEADARLLAFGARDLAEAKAEIARLRAVLDDPTPMVFADGREPTANERHLRNLLSWRDLEARRVREELAHVRAECERVTAGYREQERARIRADVAAVRAELDAAWDAVWHDAGGDVVPDAVGRAREAMAKLEEAASG
jgi:hypothetical protein